MGNFCQIYDFQNLYKAHVAARRGKRNTREVIEFEMSLGQNIAMLSDELRRGTYTVQGYYEFAVYDPKRRQIHALHYRDRVVQHCLCDEILAPALDRKLIYDNAACRVGKGTHFALHRLNGFLVEYFKSNGSNGYFLKCDIRKFFDNIDHAVLKKKLRMIFSEKQTVKLLCQIVDSYARTPGKGLPLGNQTSQWFALFYLDGFDRLVKEKLGIKYYTRYMDDCILIHPEKEYLKKCLNTLESYVKEEIGLSFNEKTVISPLQNGVTYLGWHFYLTDSGKIVRRLAQGPKKRFKRKLKRLEALCKEEKISFSDAHKVAESYRSYVSYGHTYGLQKRIIPDLEL